MGQRLREFDYIRVAAAISVIAIHITASYSTASMAGYYWNQLMRYAVPLFIIVSGLLLYYSSGKKALSYSQFLSKRFKKVLIPYILWTVIYFIFKNRSVILVMWQKRDGYLLALSKDLLFGTGYSHLYFVIIILQLYLLFPVLKTLLEKYKFLTMVSSFLLTLLFQTAIYLSLFSAVTLPKFFIPYYIFFPTWLFYFTFGMFFASNLEAWKGRLSRHKLLIAAVWVLSLLLLILDNKFTGTYASSMKPAIMLYCFTSFFLFYILFSEGKSMFSKLEGAVYWMSAQSFIIYLSHLLVLNMIRMAMKFIGVPNLFQGDIGMMALFLATLLFTAIFAYIVSLTPFAGALGGIQTKFNYTGPKQKASLGS